MNQKHNDVMEGGGGAQCVVVNEKEQCNSCLMGNGQK